MLASSLPTPFNPFLAKLLPLMQFSTFQWFLVIAVAVKLQLLAFCSPKP
jgi:hypothetical protein